MPSPADRQSEAHAEVERIAQAMYERIRVPLVWAHAPVVMKEEWRGHVRALLLASVIRPAKREPVEPPITGQTTIEEQLDG